MMDSKPVQPAEDWGVVLQSVPSKNKKEILKRLSEIFQIDKRDAEQILSNMPLILVDNLSFGLAARIKKFFQTIGAVVETTNHDMIKKNCFQVLWPQTPDLSFFVKQEAGLPDTPAKGKKAKGGFSFFEKKEDKKGQEPPKTPPQETLPPVQEFPPAPPEPTLGSPLPMTPTKESPESVPLPKPEPLSPPEESPETVPSVEPELLKPQEEPPAILPVSPQMPEPPPVSEEKPEAPSSGVDTDWERRAAELNEKLRKFHAEKQEQHAQHAEAAEKAKTEYEQQLVEEKKKAEEMAKAMEELQQKHAENHEALSREGEEWRSKADTLNAKVQELEALLTQKATEVEEEKQKSADIARNLEDLHQKDIQRQEMLARQGEEWRVKAETLAAKVQELETNLSQKGSEVALLSQQKAEVSQIAEKNAAEARREISVLRDHEQESSKKIEGLERTLQEMSESLRSRDGVLAQFEKQITELAEKTRDYETLRREHTQLSKERATIRQEYDGKLGEREMRLAKTEEEHRRYRSRVDRKNAAAARELGEWIRGLDTIRQGLQKLILFLGSESAVLEAEKKSNLKSPLTRGPDAPSGEHS